MVSVSRDDESDRMTGSRATPQDKQDEGESDRITG
jgi:hypothetical protein